VTPRPPHALARLRAAALALVLALVGGCAHSPEPVFYALSVRPGAEHRTRPLVVELRRPSLPAYLDRQHIVRRATSERLDLGGDPHWAAPLDELTSNTLARDLTARLPNCFVLTEGRGIGANPDFVVELEISRFELDEHDKVALDALIAVRPNTSEQRPALERTHFDDAPLETGVAGTVAGMSAALARLADAIAANVERASSGG
jgi:uncharacterized lipoprotein YmbA